MTWSTISSGAASPRIRAWPLELELEVCAHARCELTAERLRALAALLNEADGTSLVSAEAHGPANLVRIRLTVDAHDRHDALGRASALVRDSASTAGLGPAVLVAARGATGPPSGHRMG
jgi:hypothetical protein